MIAYVREACEPILKPGEATEALLKAELEGGVLARDTALFNELWAEFQERTARWLR